MRLSLAISSAVLFGSYVAALPMWPSGSGGSQSGGGTPPGPPSGPSNNLFFPDDPFHDDAFGYNRIPPNPANLYGHSPSPNPPTPHLSPQPPYVPSNPGTPHLSPYSQSPHLSPNPQPQYTSPQPAHLSPHPHSQLSPNPQLPPTFHPLAQGPGHGMVPSGPSGSNFGAFPAGPQAGGPSAGGSGNTNHCQHCNYVAAAKTHLRDHMIVEHPNERLYHCPHEGCTVGSNYQGTVNRHFNEQHGTPLECPAGGCTRTFHRQSELQSHIQKNHRNYPQGG